MCLPQIYVERGLPYRLAREVAEVLTENDVVRAHARDELGIGALPGYSKLGCAAGPEDGSPGSHTWSCPVRPCSWV